MKRIKSLVSVVGLLTATMLFNQECQSQTSAPAAQPAAKPAAPAPTAAPAAPMAAPAAPAGGSAIVGKAAFSGAAPAMPRLKREADPFCAKTPMTDEEVLVNPNGTLKNVVIRVTAGATAGATPPAAPVEIDQSNCMYRPRVLGAVTGEKLLIRNGDPVLHNVHSYVGATTGFNQAQMKGSKDIEKTVAAGVMKFKCDVHPWMTGYIVGNDNPFICVTGDSGECSLAGVPPGTYTVEAWHEKFGAKTATLTVAAGMPAVAGFSFP